MTLVETLATIFCSIIVFLATAIKLLQANKANQNLEQAEKAKNLEHITKAFSEFYNAKSNEIDILKLMTFNMVEIKEYYSLSKNQAKRAFTLAVASFVFGLLLFGTAILCALLMQETIGVVIPAICGAILEFVSGANLMIYNKTLDQLNVYYRFLHDNERFLSAVKIVENITSENRDKVYSDIIRIQMQGQIEAHP